MISNCCGKVAKLEFQKARGRLPEGYYWICPGCKKICLPERGARDREKDNANPWFKEE